jgi:hypothetical protein
MKFCATAAAIQLLVLAGFDIGIHNGDMKYNAKWEVIMLTYPYKINCYASRANIKVRVDITQAWTRE